MRQVGYLLELYWDARSPEYKKSAVQLHLIIRNRMYKCDFKLPPQCEWDIRTSGLLDSDRCWLPTFRGNLSVPTLRIKQCRLTLSLGPIGCAETPVTTRQHCVKPQKSEVFELAGWGDLWCVVLIKFRENRLVGSECGSFCFTISARPSLVCRTQHWLFHNPTFP